MLTYTLLVYQCLNQKKDCVHWAAKGECINVSQKELLCIAIYSDVNIFHRTRTICSGKVMVYERTAALISLTLQSMRTSL